MDNEKLIMDLQKRVEHMDDQIAQLKEKMEVDNGELKEKVNAVLQILSGNKYDPTDIGMVGEVNALKKRVEMLEKWRDKALWLLIGMSLTAGISISAIIGKIVEAFK